MQMHGVRDLLKPFAFRPTPVCPSGPQTVCWSAPPRSENWGAGHRMRRKRLTNCVGWRAWDGGGAMSCTIWSRRALWKLQAEKEPKDLPKLCVTCELVLLLDER